LTERLLAICLLLVFCGIGSSTAFGIGTATIRRAEDLVVTVDSTWTGGGSGGYFPIRIRVQNRGPERALTVRFSPIDEPAPLVRRTVEIPQNAVVNVTLSVPCVSHASYGRLEVLQQDRVISNLTETIDLPDANFAEWPALLVISSEEVDLRGFEESAVYVEEPWIGSSGFYGSGSADYQVVDPTLLPRNWVDYTALDLVAVSMPTFAGLEEEQRSAILDWVISGGTLIVGDVGKRPTLSTDLADLLRLSEYAAASDDWSPPEAEHPKGVVYNEEVEAFLRSESLATTGRGARVQEQLEATWPDDTVFRRSIALGRVYGIDVPAFPGNPTDWRWIVNDLGPGRSKWIMRHGMTPRQPNPEFLEFLIPSVRGVPVTVILILITLFAIIIGPLNYLYLWKKSRLYLLVLTIPSIALGTSIALFAYSAVAHGFGVRSRVRSLTILDQRANRSVTNARVALYAGLAPSEGLRFSPETAVFPIWSPTTTAFEQASVDWSEQQHFASGWLKSRTRTQFLVTSLRDQRGRLEVTDGEGPQAANGLEWDVRALIVCTSDGRMWFAEGLGAGETASLSPLRDEHRAEFARLLTQNAPDLPERLTRYDSGPFSPLSPYGEIEVNVSHQFEQGMLEKNLTWLSEASSPGFTMPIDSYAAILAEDPGVDIGLNETEQEASLHVLVGYY
jgi:hypothetical protein